MPKVVPPDPDPPRRSRWARFVSWLSALFADSPPPAQPPPEGRDREKEEWLDRQW